MPQRNAARAARQLDRNTQNIHVLMTVLDDLLRRFGFRGGVRTLYHLIQAEQARHAPRPAGSSDAGGFSDAEGFQAQALQCRWGFQARGLQWHQPAGSTAGRAGDGDALSAPSPIQTPLQIVELSKISESG